MSKRYLVGWNELGRDPDIAPRQADTWERARNIFQSELYWLEDGHIDEAGKVQANRALQSVRAADGTEAVSFKVGNCVYWIDIV